MPVETGTIDVRGKPCPQPVVMVKRVLENEGNIEGLEILTDNSTANENLQKFLAGYGYIVSIIKEGSDYRLGVSRDYSKQEQPVGKPKDSGKQKTTVLITSDDFGRGSKELGAILMKMFIYTLQEAQTKPERIILLNGGVKLAGREADAADDLCRFAAAGGELLICGTCLDYYGMQDKIVCGDVSNMYDIWERMTASEKVITIT